MSFVSSVVVVCLVLASCAKSPTGPTTPQAPPIRVLIFSATEGFRHDSIATAREVMTSIGAPNGITSTATEDPTAFSVANLANYDAVMFAMTSGEILFSNEQKSAILAFVSGGKGFVGFHSATDTLRTWPDYGRLVGAYVVDHPWTQPARVIVEDASHPATGVRDTFNIEEEFYVFDANPRVRVQVLLRLDAASVGATGDYPLAWAQSFGRPRLLQRSWPFPGDLAGPSLPVASDRRDQVVRRPLALASRMQKRNKDSVSSVVDVSPHGLGIRSVALIIALPLSA